MSENARTEAERIVETVENETAWRRFGVWDSRRFRDGLVAALAAAIEATEVHSEWGIDAALDELREALSELR